MNPPLFSARTAREAALWLTLSMDGELPEAQAEAFRRWRNADPEHERAWQHIEAMRRRFTGIDRQAGYKSLARPLPGRRQALRSLVLLGAFAGLGGLAWRNAWYPGADRLYSTGSQAPRQIMLEDGSRLTLDADTEVAVRFDQWQRRVVLRRGRLLVETGHRPGHARQPFVVETAQGSVRALGTRFSVEPSPLGSRVAVYDGAVEIRPKRSAAAVERLDAGQRAEFGNDHASAAAPAGNPPPWSLGLLVADGMRLDAFLAELGRYRPGLLRCSEAAAGMLISGVYPLADSDAILAALPHALPVSVRSRSRYWVTVEAL